MAANYTAVVQRDGEWWIGWVEEVPGSTPRGVPARNCWRTCVTPSKRRWNEPRRGAGRRERRLRRSGPLLVKRHELLEYSRGTAPPWFARAAGIRGGATSSPATRTVTGGKDETPATAARANSPTVSLATPTPAT